MSGRRAAALLAVLPAALALPACGGRSTTTPTVTVTTSTVTVAAAPPAADTTTDAAPARTAVIAGLGSGRFDPAAIYAREAPGVVTVLSSGAGGSSSLGLPGGGAGLGSGFVVSADGEVVTNAHVVTSGQGGSLRRARRIYVRFPDGNQVPGRIMGVDPYVDVALVKVDPRGLRLHPLPLGSDASTRVGAPVAAIGSPFGEEQSLSVGIVSARDRSIRSLTRFAISGAIQTDAAINHGNSGGPLLDARGRVIGINSQIESSSGDGTGVGFAVPVDSVRRSLAMLRTKGRPSYAYLGGESIQVYPQLARRFSLGTDHGAWVQGVTKGGPADRAGLRGGHGTVLFQGAPVSPGGDVIVAVGDREIRRDADVAVALQRYAPGDRVTVRIMREGRARSVVVTLGARSTDTSG